MAGLNESRRSFLARALRVLGGLAVIQAGWVAVTALMPRKQDAQRLDGPGVVVAGPVDRFAPGSVTPFAESKFYLSRLEDGGFLALHRKCTHLGCSVPWNDEEQRFACPCHASAFDVRGDVVNAPAPRPLDLFAVEVRGGQVLVDTGQVIRRRAFDPDQVVRG